MPRHPDVPIEPAANRLLRRSRTGCLTCRRRKKKCPEQYDDSGDCERCKEGGWRCIRPGQVDCNPRSSTITASSTPIPTNSSAQPLNASLNPFTHTPASELASSHDYTTTLTTATTTTPFPLPIPENVDWTAFFDDLAGNGTERAVAGPSGLNGNAYVDDDRKVHDETVTQMLPGPLGLSTSTSTLTPTAMPFDPARMGTMMTDIHAGPLGFGKLSEWLLQPGQVEVVDTAVGLPEPDFFSQYLAPLDDNSDNTISISLLPDHNSILPNPGWSANVLPGIALGENVDVWTTDSQAIPFQQHVQADGDLSERYEALLVEFYANYVIPAWTVTYTRQARAGLAQRCMEMTSSCPVTRTARRAVSATFLQIYKERKTQWPMGSSSRQAALDALPPHYLVPTIDPKPILQAGLALVYQSGHGTDPSALLWALSDLNMAAHALSDADNFHITNRLANDMIKDALAKPGMFEINFPDWDSFALRVASMVDLNVCLTNRQRTVFDYSSVATRAWPRDMSLICDKETTWFGLPPGLSLLLLRVANITADGHAASQLGLAPSPSLIEQADRLETELIEYQPRLQEPAPQGSSEPFEVSSAERAVEMDIWKTTGLVLLDRLVRGRAVLEPVLRERLEDMQAMLQALMLLCRARERKSKNFIDFWTSYYSGPAFLVGSLAVHEADRQFYRRFLREVGPEKALGSLLDLLEKTWTASDAAGHVCDWFDIVAQSNTRPLFF